MIFSSLKLNNIGLYKGENFLDLYPRDNKNIILFGGKNGAGKTTILESIKLCLYGNTIYGFTKNEYQNFIKKTIHRGENSGYIELEFIYFTESSEERYKVLRKFNISKKLKEEFVLYKNGEILKDIPKEYWQDFISDIIPPGLVNFFFFDGEKIEKLADDLTETELIDDVKNLIGVSLIDDLYASLGVIEKKYLKEENLPKSILSKIEKLEEEKEKLGKTLFRYIQERAQINQKLHVISKELTKVEKEFYRKGGKLFKDYEQLKAKREILTEELDSVKNEIRYLSSHDLPLALGLDLLKELIQQLEVETEYKKHSLKKEILEEKFKELKKVLKDINIPKEKLKRIQLLFSISEIPKVDIIHNLPDNEVYQIKYIYQNLEKNVIPQAKKLFRKLEILEEEIAQVEIALQSVPKEEILAPYLRRIKELEEEKTKLLLHLKDVEKDIKECEEKIKALDKEISKLNKTISQKHKNKRVIQLIHKSQNALQKFKKEFTKRKISILKREILEALSKLERKKEFIVDLDINSETFEITLYDRNRKIIPLDKLSAGERQIFAISFLWGLAKTSGKSLPVIIDTPLGRLDSKHRENLAKNYFPNISHQVILLSTDTEIDKHLYFLMEKHISHTYHLAYDNNCMCTKIEEGYFWDEIKLTGAKNEV
ncbi:DNA sulfur modification protein DndD [Persephonella atlantica]|uniref:DNA sulfur modification protein DndD n=1 Tax=Persephonella atlantica TaxID=2699429 RepID=A0ABS1GJK8_9AQUI|nr:DNA sulfur modification protein DndD [Persephonella atlantica]MBK3333123.1 DNA sulfur modification protein DndD [Persephonella atlantica]